MYIVIDNQTGQQATRTVYKTRASAAKAADRLDQSYGAIRYRVRCVDVTIGSV